MPNFVLSGAVITLSLIVCLSVVSNANQIAFGLFENLFGPESPCLSKKNIQVKQGYSQYLNSGLKVEIQFPSDWNKEEENFKVGSEGSALYSLATFQPNSAEGFKTTLELEINEISKYTSDSKSLSGLGEFEKESITLSPDATILSSNTIEINGCPAYQIIYLEGFPNSEEQWKRMLTFFIACDKEYVIRYTATENDLYDKYLRVIDDMLQTFKINGC